MGDLTKIENVTFNKNFVSVDRQRVEKAHQLLAAIVSLNLERHGQKDRIRNKFN